MADYYTTGSDPADGSDLDSSVIRAEWAALAAGFAKIAGYTGAANRIPHINAGATAMTSTAGFTFDGTTLVAPALTVTNNAAINGTALTTTSATFTALAGATTLLTIGGTGASAVVATPGTLDATSPTAAALKTAGGLGVAKALWVGGLTNIAGAATLQSTLTYGGVTLTAAVTGTGKMVLDTSPTLATPVLGVATATSINKITITQPATGATLTLTDGKTLAATHTLTLSGTDGTTMTFPSTSATIARTDAANTFTGIQSMTSPAVTTSITTPSTTFTAFAGATTLLTLGGTGATAVVAIPGTLEWSTTTAALTVAGGTYIAKKLKVVGAVDFGSTLSVTGTSALTGNVGIGGASNSQIGLYLQTSTTSGTNHFGIRSRPVGSSGTTNTLSAFESLPTTAAASYNTTNIYGFYAYDASKGTDSTVTTNIAFFAADQTAGSSNNRGFQSAVSAGAGKANFYASGSADNIFAGNTRLGSSTAPTVALDVTGAALISSTLGVTGNVTLSAGALILTATATPTGTGAGVVGQIAWDTSYLYICTATNDWRRVAITDF